MNTFSIIADSIGNCVSFMKGIDIDLGFYLNGSLFDYFVCLSLSYCFTVAFGSVFGQSVENLGETDIYD